jgi:orotidine-5'-phosphate decarboxylase
MAKRLLELMDRKKTNLCVSVDVTTTAEVLDIVKAVGPSVCMVKVSSDYCQMGDAVRRNADPC